jgi:hypothetical protein
LDGPRRRVVARDAGSTDPHYRVRNWQPAQDQNAPDGNVVVIDGTRQILEHLHVRADPPPRHPNCENQPVGWRAGFLFGDRASHNTLRYSIATELTAGVHLNTHSHHNRVLNNRLVANTYMSVNTKGGREDDFRSMGSGVAV